MPEIDLNTLAEYIHINKINLCPNYNDWVAIAFSIASQGQNYESAFLKIASVDKTYNERKSLLLFRSALRKSERNTLGRLINACKMHGIDYSRFYVKSFREGSGKSGEPACIPLPERISVLPKISVNFLDADLVTQSFYPNNNLLYFLSSVFDKVLVEEAARLYRIGSCKDGSTIFWQIDKEEKVRSGKIIQYNKDTGHRIKTIGIGCVHSILKRQKKLPGNYELQQCLFGEHLLSMFSHKTIVLVESEKTALIYSLFQPSVLCLATGGLSNLKTEMVSCLKGRYVMVLPDLDAYENWKERVNMINKEVTGLNLHLSDAMFKICTKEDIQEKKDIADLIIQLVQYRKTTKQPSKQEDILKRMSEKNPTLQLLIDSFGLELYQK